MGKWGRIPIEKTASHLLVLNAPIGDFHVALGQIEQYELQRLDAHTGRYYLLVSFRISAFLSSLKLIRL